MTMVDDQVCEVQMIMMMHGVVCMITTKFVGVMMMS